jgi:hypothetical protein
VKLERAWYWLKITYNFAIYSIDIVTAYMLDAERVGVRLPAWSRIFPPPYCPGRLWDATNLLFNLCQEPLLLTVKQQAYEADH